MKRLNRERWEDKINKMKIGIDIDGVMTDMYNAIIDTATEFCYSNNIDYKIDNFKYNENEMFNISEDDAERYWNRYLAEYAVKCPPRRFTQEVIEKLKKDNEIYIITARDEEGLPEELHGTMQEMVKKWLKENNIEYDKLIFTKEKLKICRENNIDIMIEDSPKNIEEIHKEIKVLCFDAPYNRKVAGENITRVYSWYDILRKLD